MADIAGLRALRAGRFFANWDEFVAAERVAASDDSLRRLVDDLLALGAAMSEADARAAVDACVQRFNDPDEACWICTIEREDIFEQIGRAIDLCGFDYDEEWIGERDW